MKKIVLSIDGMTCSACSSGLEKYLNKQEGIKNASVNLVMATANILYDEKKINTNNLNEFVRKAGFRSLGEFKEENLDNNLNLEKNKLLIFTFLLLFVMYICMGHIINLPNINHLDIKLNPYNYSLFMLFNSILFLIYGFDIIKSGVINLIHKYPNMDTLVCIGVLSSFIYSLYNLFLFIFFKANLDNLYFESVCSVIYFVKLGRFIDKNSSNKVKDTLKDLVKITPDYAFVKKGDLINKVTIDEVKLGDILVCKAGERVAVDGEVILGSAHLDESFITGESMPYMKKQGDRVIAGSLNYDGYVEYSALKIGKDSTISEIVRLVSESSSSKVPISRFADRIASIFVPLVILISVLTFIYHLFTGSSLESSLVYFVCVLVVSCPCALGLATPLSIIVSEGDLLKKGILIKNGEVFETIKKTNVVVFDKTGTLTYGKFKISKIHNFSDVSDKKLIQIIGSLESKSNHPIARAFNDYLKENSINLLEVKNFENVSGYGVMGIVDDKKVIIGNSKILKKYGIKNEYVSFENELSLDGNTIVYVVVDGNIYGVIGVRDVERKEAKGVIKELNSFGIECILLSGDNSDTCSLVSKKVGIKNVISNVTPIDKNKIIKKYKDEGKFVVMCGDGVNDSPALALSDVGISISDGSDIAINSSDVVLINNNLNGIITLINKSNKTIRIIKQNLFWAFFYNALMIPIAMGLFKSIGVSLNPMFASLSMIFSSLFVVVNSLRLRK